MKRNRGKDIRNREKGKGKGGLEKVLPQTRSDSGLDISTLIFSRGSP